MIGKVHGGGNDSGIPSNIGILKAYVEEVNAVLKKGSNYIKLNPSFKPEKTLGVIVNYGGYLGGQPMMNGEGNYEADYGIAPQLQKESDGTLTIKIFASGYYPSRKLQVIVFYQ